MLKNKSAIKEILQKFKDQELKEKDFRILQGILSTSYKAKETEKIRLKLLREKKSQFKNEILSPQDGSVKFGKNMGLT